MNNPPAFPVTTGSDGGCINEGMTLRDYFAAAAMQGIISIQSGERFDAIPIVHDSFRIADAMLKAREQ